MKRLAPLLFLLLTAIVVQAQPMTKEQVKVVPMADTLRKLIMEGKTGFTARRGKRIADVNGEVRYATAAINCMKAADQYITVKDGKEYYILELRGAKLFEDLYQCMNLLTDRLGNTGPTRFKWDPNDHGPKDEWVHFWLSETHETPPVCEYKTVPTKHSKTIIIIGPGTDWRAIESRQQELADKAWRAKRRADYKYTGNPEMDSIGLSHYGDFWGDDGTGKAFENLFGIQANNNYDNTVGEAFTAPDGSTRYRAPLWLGADQAFYRNDTTGLGTMLYLFFPLEKPHTMSVLASLRSVFEGNPHSVVGNPSPHEFIYMDRDGGSTAMYRFDTSTDAPYKGLTIIFMQLYKLKEKIAKSAADQAIWDAVERNRKASIENNPGRVINNQVKVRTGTTHSCLSCNGRGRVMLSIGGGQMASGFCPACNGTGTVTD